MAPLIPPTPCLAPLRGEPPFTWAYARLAPFTTPPPPCRSFSGRSWGAAETAAQLITSGQLPPFIVAGIDHAGPLRSFDYLPYEPGTGPGAAEEWTLLHALLTGLACALGG